MTTFKQLFELKLNYKPDKKFPLVISKTTSRWFIYEKDEPDPVLSKSFKNSAEAKKFAEDNFPDYKIEVEGANK
jgi:hypothetical protein